MPPIYYINLASRSDRRAFMEQRLGELGLAAQRVPAVALAAISQTDAQRYCHPTRVPALSQSQLACAMSHVQCWRAFLQTDVPWGLVFEDDVFISARLPQFLTDFLGAPASDSLDLVHLEATARRSRVLPARVRIGGTALRPFCSTQWGAAGYLISARAAQQLLSRTDLFDAPVDQLLFRPYWAPGRSLRMALADPALCIQSNKVESTELARGNLSPVLLARVTFPMRLKRLWHTAGPFAASVAYHLRHLPMGVRSEVIPYDTPEKRYVGSKTRGYGTELSD